MILCTMIGVVALSVSVFAVEVGGLLKRCLSHSGV